jgi:hypothetical protein
VKLTQKQLKQIIKEELRDILLESDLQYEKRMAEEFSEVIRKFADSTPGYSFKEKYEVYRYDIDAAMDGNYDDNRKVYEMADFADDVMRKWDRNNKLHRLATVDGQSFMQAFEMAQDILPDGRH